MQYWLRRNNTDKGPFTKEALLSQGLNSSDLIRIDGDSEWKSPNSFTEFQQAIPKPKYKFTADKKLIEIKDDSGPSVRPDATVPKPEQPAGPSPFKRMPSALPKKKGNVPSAADNTITNVNEKARERAKMGAAQEPATGHSGAHIQAHASTAGHHQKIHTQVQSLDDAPLREHRHHPTPKPVRAAARPQNSHFFKEFFLPILIIGGIGLLAWWGYKQFTTPSADNGRTTVGASAIDSAQVSSSNDDTQQNSTAKTDGPAAIPMHPSGGNTTKANTQVKAGSDSNKAATKAPAKATPTTQTPAAATTTTPKPKTTVENAASPQDSSNDKKTAAQQAPPAKPPAVVEKKADTPAAVTAKKEPEQKASAKPTQKASSIADYVALSLNKAPEAGIKNVKIKVHNTSKDDLNIAVVEIKYYDKDGKFIQGETLQTGKINAGKSTTLKVPSSKSAERISYKVSLISGDNVYLMGR